MGAAPPFVGPPVHAFRLGGKLPERVINAAAQPPADFLNPSKPPLVWRLQPALIAQPVAVATGEHAPTMYSRRTRRAQYPHWNHNRFPPNLQGVQAAAKCCSRPPQFVVTA